MFRILRPFWLQTASLLRIPIKEPSLCPQDRVPLAPQLLLQQVQQENVSESILNKQDPSLALQGNLAPPIGSLPRSLQGKEHDDRPNPKDLHSLLLGSQQIHYLRSQTSPQYMQSLRIYDLTDVHLRSKDEQRHGRQDRRREAEVLRVISQKQRILNDSSAILQ